MLICFFNGFSAGLPLFYIFQLVPGWLRRNDIDLKTIGLFSLVQLFYNWKFIWSPLMERYPPPFLGRRRGWMVICQTGIMASMFAIGFFDPKQTLGLIVIISGAIAFFSASQDIVLDAYRRELLKDEELGLGNSMYMNAYRVAGFIPGGLGFILADHMPWASVHIVIGLFMLVAVAHSFLIPETPNLAPPPKSIKEAVIEPIREFFSRETGVGHAWLIIGFIFLYKIGDQLATAQQTSFFIDMGFSNTEIGTIVKVSGFVSFLIGSFLGGAVIYKYGLNPSLYVFGIAQMVTILGFAFLSIAGHDQTLLAVVVFLEYFATGTAASGLMAFMAKETSKTLSATQMALLTSFLALPRTFSGYVAGLFVEGVKEKDVFLYNIFGAVEGVGWTKFFYICVACAIPGMVLLFWVAPLKKAQ